MHVLDDRAYAPSPTSAVLPDIDLPLLASFATPTSTAEAKRAYRETLAA